MSEIVSGDPVRAAMQLCRRHFISVAVFSALVNLLYIAPTLYMLQIYDRVVPTQGGMTLLFISLVLIFALATLSLLDRVRTRLLVRAGVRLDRELAPLILRATLRRADSASSRQALREFDVMRQALTGQGIIALFDAPWIPIYILACLLVHPLLGLVAFLGSLILPLIAWRNEKATKARLLTATEVATRVYASQDQTLGAADTVRALGMREAMVTRHLRYRESMMAEQTGANFAAGGYLAVGKFVRLLLQSLALGFGALLAIDNQISAGAIFAASFLVARALAPIEQLIANWKSIVQARISYRNLGNLLSSVPPDTANTLLPRPNGSLQVEQVIVLNPARDRAIVNGVSFAVTPGEVIAIVGPSGAGKSTLVRAIAGAANFERGAIRFDGAEQRDWDPERLARHVGYLPQEATLFAGTVKENIARFATEVEGDTAAVDEAVIAAARKVGAHDLILRMPGGYDYMLDFGGRGLSAGQAQRVAMARAVYGGPSLLILDEPNAHLDAEGDAQLVAAISALKAEGVTVLIVSHKLSILPVVDKILVMRDGRADMFGPRDEILPKLAPPNVRRVVPRPASPEAANG